MGKILSIVGADFSENSVPVSSIKGTPNYTLTPSLGSGSYKLNNLGVCIVPDLVSPNNQGQFALGNYGAFNENITRIKACWDVKNSGIESFTQLFCLFTNLAYVECTHLKTDEISDFSHCFNSCYALQRIDLSTWKSNGVAVTDNMFNACQVLEWVDLGELVFNRNKKTTFNNCPSLRKVRSHLTDETKLAIIQSLLNEKSAGGSSNWVQGTDADGCAMFTPTI